MNTAEPRLLFYGSCGTAPAGWAETLAALEPGLGKDETAERLQALACRLVSFATEFGLSGNLWHHWLAYVLMMHENPFSLACERRTVTAAASLRRLAEPDLAVFRDLFAFDFSSLEKEAGTALFPVLTAYRAPYGTAGTTKPGEILRTFSGRLARARDVKAFVRLVTAQYETYGVGIYGLYRAFRVAEGETPLRLVPVTEGSDATFDDLIGCEEQKKTLCGNTEAFLAGAHANNVLLYGDSGTGKSTSVHALMHEYFSRGLRLVELSKQNRRLLLQVLSEVKKRNYRFILFLDDLSFEENESDYKELKAMLEGALETRTDRVLIYATSNRRHLIRETWSDRNDMEYQEDIHRSDTMEEKLSLASRFGVTIYYAKPDAKEYLRIVRALAERNGIGLGEKELADAARKWELRHGGMSGRTAGQLIAWLAGEAARQKN